MDALKDRVAIVTGGTGALGRAVSHALLRAGAKAVVTPWVVAAEVPLIERQVGDFKSRLETPEINVTREEEVQKLVQDVASRHGRVDVLVNVVGGFWGGVPVEETSERDWDAMMNINLKTAFFCAKAVVPQMRRNRFGRIVCVSARLGVNGAGNFAAYAVAKGALITFVRSLSEEVIQDDITVNAIGPSLIDTEANRQAMPDADHSKWVKPEEIADVITFLASDQARVISGAYVPVYGKA